MFFRGSRYEAVGEATHAMPDGRVVRYKLVRFIPPTRAQSLHRVDPADRLDLLAWERFRDPERFWRICDANGALWPDDLLEPGSVLLIPASEG